MISLDHIAFVDLETSGLSPTRNRITEIGVVTAGPSGVDEWTTLINPGTPISEHSRLFNGIENERVRNAPRFRDIAAELAARLAGRLFVAHNARFDFGFLRAEFERVGIEFRPQVLCSVMLSRKLYPALAGHDLDTLMHRHGLSAEVRHRALPDARLIWQFWQILRAAYPGEQLESVVGALLAGPVLPMQLDPALIDALPEAPGVYVLRGEVDVVLRAGKADNLKLRLIDYFRLDRSSAKALAISHQVRTISWHATCGSVGAHLRLKQLCLRPGTGVRRAASAFYSWRFAPEHYPCVELVSLPARDGDDCESYGIFASERKARYALLRLAARNSLCHAVLGIRETARDPCTACALDHAARCGVKAQRLRQLCRTAAAIWPWRLARWPYPGPIGIRERSDLHIIDEWRYLGTAQSEEEIHALLESRVDVWDSGTFAYLSKTIPKLSTKRIVKFPGRAAALASLARD